MIALCSKRSYVDEQEPEKKFSTKGVSKRQNQIMWRCFKAALEGSKGMATNRAFRFRTRSRHRAAVRSTGIGRRQLRVLEARRAAPHARSRAWGRLANSRERVRSLWTQLFQAQRPSKTRLDHRRVCRRLPARPAGTESEHGRKRLLPKGLK